MKRFPKALYIFRVTTPGGDVDITIAPTMWDRAGKVTLRYAGGYEHLRQYFVKFGRGMYGHAIGLDDQYMIPEDVHHVLLMNETLHHRSDLIEKYVLLCGFVPDESWLQYNEENAGLMDNDYED